MAHYITKQLAEIFSPFYSLATADSKDVLQSWDYVVEATVCAICTYSLVLEGKVLYTGNTNVIVP